MPTVIRLASAALVLAALILANPVFAADSPQFRGPERDGTFQETGLARSWPEGGPPLLWSADGLGEGFASVTVVGGKVYTTGKHGDRESAFAFDDAGKLVWKTGLRLRPLRQRLSRLPHHPERRRHAGRTARSISCRRWARRWPSTPPAARSAGRSTSSTSSRARTSASASPSRRWSTASG